MQKNLSLGHTSCHILTGVFSLVQHTVPFFGVRFQNDKLIQLTNAEIDAVWTFTILFERAAESICRATEIC